MSTSLSLYPIETCAVEIPVCNIDSKPKFVVMKSGSFFSSAYNLSSSANNTSQTILITGIPNQNVFVSRKWLLRCPVTITGTASNSGSGNVLQSGYFGVRSFPLSSILQSIQMQLNNASTDVTVAEILPIIRWFNNTELENFTDRSMTPSAQDLTTEYASMVGLSNNPLNSFGNGGYQNYSRSSYGIDTSVASYSNTTTSFQLGYTLTEALNLLSPLIDHHGNDMGFFGLESAQVIVTFMSNLQRILSYTYPSGLSNLVVNVTLGQATIINDIITPSVLTSFPSVAMYPYTKYNIFQTNISNTLAPNSSTVITGNTITLNSVPTGVYLCVKKPANTTTCFDTDSFLSITNVNITCDANNNILANTPPQKLYEINVKNGYMGSYDMFCKNPAVNTTTNTLFGLVGAPLYLKFQEDIIFADCALISNGVSSKITFQAQVTVTNQSQVTTYSSGQLALFYIIEYDGVCTIGNGQCNFSVGVLSKDDVLDAMNYNSVKYNDVVHYQGRGWNLADIWNKLKDWGQKIKNSNVYQKVAPIIKSELGPYGAVADSLGFGKKHSKKRY